MFKQKQILLSFVVVGVMLLGVTATFVFRSQNPVPPADSIPTPQPNNNDVNTNGLKLYRNEEWGFEYQYPPIFILKEKNFPVYIFADSGEVCKNLFQKESKSRRLLNQTTLADPSTKFKVEVVTVSVYENSDNLSLDDWLNSGAKFLEKHSEECKYDDKNYLEIRLDNKKRLTIDNTPGIEGFAGCCMASNKNIYLAKNNNIYHLSFSGSVNVDLKCVPFLYNKYSCPTIGEDIINQIISTFKFLK